MRKYPSDNLYTEGYFQMKERQVEMKHKGIWIGVFMIGIGLLFVFWSPAQHFLIERASQNSISSLDAEMVHENKDNEAEFDFEAIEMVTASSLFSFSNSENNSAIGIITVPEVDMEVPIFKGLSNNDLLIGAGTMKEHQKLGEGNYALAGHNWRDQTTLFSPLHRAEEDMSIYVTDLETTFEYTITDIVMVAPDRIDVIEDTDDATLTLVTCNHDGTERLIIQATQVSQTPYK